MLLEGSSLGALWTVVGWLQTGGIVFSVRLFKHYIRWGTQPNL